jgi:hypothetical protein
MGLTNQMNLSNLSVYPNPISGQLTIQYQLQLKDLISINLFDSYGRLFNILQPSNMQLSGMAGGDAIEIGSCNFAVSGATVPTWTTT